VAARSILGVQHLRAPLLDDVSAARAEGQAGAGDQARGGTGVLTARRFFMSRYQLDDDDDLDEDDEDELDEDDDEEDDEDGDEEEEETWQV
jgi:hypothetical protein